MNINIKKGQKDLAIIIPFINLPNYIIDLIKTIKTKYSYHIYLINNNSNDETVKKLSHLIDDSNITVINNKQNIGVSASWNQGMVLAIDEYNVKYISILNNDILLHSACINNMIEIIKEKDYLLVSGFDYAKECNIPQDILTKNIPSKLFIVDAPEFSCYTINVNQCNKLFKKEYPDEEYPGFFDQKFYPAYFEDNDYHYRAKLNKQRCVKTNSALYYHYGSRTIKENPNIEEISNSYYLINKDRYFNKWGGFPGKEKFKIAFNKDNI